MMVVIMRLLRLRREAQRLLMITLMDGIRTKSMIIHRDNLATPNRRVVIRMQPIHNVMTHARMARGGIRQILVGARIGGRILAGVRIVVGMEC